MNEINAEGRTAFYELIWTLLWEYEDKDDITDKDEELFWKIMDERLELCF